MFKISRLWCLAVLACASASGAELVYTPINPLFGGSPLNGATLLNLAKEINTFKDEAKTELEKFGDKIKALELTRLQASILAWDGDPTTLPQSLDNEYYNVTVTLMQDGGLRIDTLDKTTLERASFEVSPP